MVDSSQLLIGGRSGEPFALDTRMANRHGIISGATGTGKTVTLQILAEGFSRLGVPVFMSDAKGDLSGIGAAGETSEGITDRLREIGIENYGNRPVPTLFWDLSGAEGHPLRTTISDVGPLLLSNLLELNDTQSGVLYSCFKLADDEGLLLLDLKDLRAMLRWMADNAGELKSDYGHMSGASIGAIQRRLLVLEEQGGDRFFGEPALQLQDLLHTDFSGHGVVSILEAKNLISRSPRVYATVLLWLLSELFETLPEVGDADRPRLVLFFDEAHLLFDHAPKALEDKIEQVVRLIRSKGVGVYFITQSPLDIPEGVLGQLGLRIQHALRAFTPKDSRTVKAVAETFRTNPRINTLEAITSLGIGEALVSALDRSGAPTPVERMLIRPPESLIGTMDAGQKAELFSRSPLRGKYEESIDRESAYELLKIRAEQAAAAQAKAQTARSMSRGSRRQSAAEALVKSAARSIGSHLGRQLIRGVLGSLLGGRR